ncbi:MAG: hypothetical protein WC364_11170 [Eubacteriales bacterium]|jgi:hypothetical protein
MAPFDVRLPEENEKDEDVNTEDVNTIVAFTAVLRKKEDLYVAECPEDGTTFLTPFLKKGLLF